MMSSVGSFLKDSELLILFAEDRQILLKISVIPIISTHHPTQLIIAAHNCHNG
jgi:hypothetical protein